MSLGESKEIRIWAGSVSCTKSELTFELFYLQINRDRKIVAISAALNLRSQNVTSSQPKSITFPFHTAFYTSSSPVSSNMRNDYNALKRNSFNLEMNVFLSFCANRLIISVLRIWHIMHATDNGIKIDVINHGKNKGSAGFHRGIQIDLEILSL